MFSKKSQEMETETKRYDEYTLIRNTEGIGNYQFDKKRKYGKRVNNRERMILQYDESKSYYGRAFYDNFYYYELMPKMNYKYVDEYIKLIPLYLIKTTNIVKRDHNSLYWEVFNLNPENIIKYPEFWHNGCFYLAMIYCGFQYKKRRNGLVDWNCRIKKC